MPTYQKIILTNNSTNSAAPVASDIDQGELALNLVDGSLYFKDVNNTIREFAFSSNNAGTSYPGALSQHISEDSNGVGINVNPISGVDLNVGGDVKIGGTLDVESIYRSINTDFLKLSGGTDNASDGANIELYGSSNATHANKAYIDAEEFYLRDVDNTTYKYISLGNTTPVINIGGPNTTGLAELNIGDSRTSNGNSQIILRSKPGGANSNIAKIIRDTSDNLKILNHTGHTQIHADEDKAVKLISSADNSDSQKTINLIARDGKVKIGSLGGAADVNTSKTLDVIGSIKGRNIELTDDDAILFGTNNANRITHNDGLGVFNIRAGHVSDQTANPDVEEYTTGNGAAYIGAKNLTTIGAGWPTHRIEMKVSADTTASAGGQVTWGDAFKLYKDKLTYGGKLGLGNAQNPQGDIHVAGTGGSDNVIVEANTNTSNGARITLRSSSGTFSSKTNTLNNQNLGEVVALGYQNGFVSAGRIDWKALNDWTGSSNTDAEMLIKVRGGTTEQTVMKLYPTDAGKVAINCPYELSNLTDPTLYIGGNQTLGTSKDDYIDHLKLEAASDERDNLIFKSHRREADIIDTQWHSASQRIQRTLELDDGSVHAGFIDFCSYTDSTFDGGGKELFVFGKGNDTLGNIPESRYLSILHDGRILQYGQDSSPTAHPDGDDLVIGKTSSSSGMTIRSGSGIRGNIFFGDSSSSHSGMISYNHLHDRMELSVNSELYPNTGQIFNGIQIASQGNVGIRLTNSTPSEALHVNGKILAEDDITAFSDERLKENIETIPNALEKVSQLRGVKFTRKDTGKKSIGVIAQEIEKVIPEVVSTTDNRDEMKSVAYGNVVGLLIEAIKDLQQEVEELKSNANR